MKTVWRNLGRAVLCWSAARFIRLCRVTGCWRTLGAWRPAALWQGDQPFILCFWHGRLAMMPYCWPRRRLIHMLISNHADGRLISHTVGHFGIQTITGSTAKGGSLALRRMVSRLRDGASVGITPDGPRGPRMRASMGAVALARISGAPLMPVTYSLSRGKVMGSWDRFLAPSPLGRGVIIWGRPITVPKEADDQAMEDCRAALETSLNRLTARADRLVGRPVVEPADPAPR